ncbi:NAD-dependent protein deacetylase of SIR2 family [Pelomyxa schiedti]|nr:NAD-dependent protein deacetylase of SIR2 family [Pelomyxa schiedti]
MAALGGDSDAMSSIEAARRAVGEADAVLIAAGAGLSAAADNDYWDKRAFAERFPGMLQHGWSFPYQLVGNPELYANKALSWGYLLSFMHVIGNLPPHEVYQSLLRDVVKGRDYFVITTNVDGFFVKNGFDPAKIYTPQGDFKFLQCSKPCCAEAVWPSANAISLALPHIDKSNQMLNDPSLWPKCPRCGREAMPHVRAGSWFINEHFAEQRQAFNQWVSTNGMNHKKVVILEIGVGYNTPGVIRLPMERLALTHDWIKLIRINKEDSTFTATIPSGRAISLEMDIVTALPQLS